MQDNIYKEIRKKIFLTAYAGGIGHLASAFSSVELLYTLYMKGIVKFDAEDPFWEERDRVIVSKGHASLAVYNVLSLAGFFREEELYTFSQPGSRLGGEANMNELPGIEACTGSLGHGLSYGMGMALAYKLQGKQNKVYVIVGDGECQEGSIWEAVMASAKYELDNLTVILDCNKVQKMDSVQSIMGISNWNDKFGAFNWQVEEVDGHNVEELYDVLAHSNQKDRPRVVIAHTIKGKGVSIMENNPGWHWRMPNRRELKKVMAELNISEEELIKCKRHI